MTDHYDSLETRPPVLRESELFAALTHAVAHALAALGWAKLLAGVNPHTINSREALAKLPLLRKSDIAAMQKEHPPFGGLNVTPPGKARRLLMSPGPIFEPEGEGKDWWGAARALYAAGFRPGDVVHNSFAYHLTPGGFILESGAHALGCAVIPGGVGNTEQQLEAIAHYKPVGLCRHAGFPQDPARHRRQERQGRFVYQARAGLRRGAARLAARGVERARRRCVAMLRHRRARRHRLRGAGPG